MRPRDLVRTVQRALPTGRRGARVLAYHLVDAGTGGPVDLPLTRFESQLALLQRAFRVVSLEDVDPEGDPRQVVLSFDDAYANFATTIWPRLRDAAFPAILYVPVGFVDGGPAPIRGADLPSCTWEQLRAMVREGLRIGSHTIHHPDVGTLDEAGLEEEIATSRALLEDRLETAVHSFCYPRGLIHGRAEPVVARTYRTAVVGGGRRYDTRTPPHAIERVSIRTDHDLHTFHAILTADRWIEETIADGIRQLRR